MAHESEGLHSPGKSHGKREIFSNPLVQTQGRAATGMVLRRDDTCGAMLHFFRAPDILYSVVSWNIMGHTSHAAEGIVMQ